MCGRRNDSPRGDEPSHLRDEMSGREEIVGEDEKKKRSKFITLHDIKMQVKKGEFISIIGDVGSGKSSLLQSIIGDLIYIPQSEID